MPKGIPVEDFENSIYIELEDNQDAKKLDIEDAVEMIIKGKVSSISQRESYDKPKKIITEIRLSGYSSKINKVGDTSFSDLAGDD